MKQYIIILCIGLILIIVGHTNINRESYREKSTPCIVLDKLETVTGKNSNRSFILVLKETPKGRVLDLDVSPKTWSQAYVGKSVTFDLSEQDIEENRSEAFKESLAAFFLLIGYGTIGITILMFSVNARWRGIGRRTRNREDDYE